VIEYYHKELLWMEHPFWLRVRQSLAVLVSAVWNFQFRTCRLWGLPLLWCNRYV